MDSLRIHSEDEHEHEKLCKKSELEDGVIAKEADCYIIVELCHVFTYVVCSREKV